MIVPANLSQLISCFPCFSLLRVYGSLSKFLIFALCHYHLQWLASKKVERLKYIAGQEDTIKAWEELPVLNYEAKLSNSGPQAKYSLDSVSSLALCPADITSSQGIGAIDDQYSYLASAISA